MPFYSSRSFSKAKLLLLAAATSVIFTAGCGLGTMATPVDEGTGSFNVTGKAMGGPVPIVGASIKIYETGVTGVAHTGIAGGYYAPTSDLTPLGTATTGTNGFFTISTVTCAHSYDDLYMTLTGGNGGGTAGTQTMTGGSNTSLLLLAAMGPCTSIPSFVDINEVTTVAAAYALAPFISIDSSTGVVNITSSATNAASASVSTGTIYHPVGLQHAFLNAANLANVSQGAAQTTITATPAAVLPTALINSVANVLQACTNSNGASPQLIFSGQGTTVLTANVLNASDQISGTLGITVGANPTVTFPGTGSYSGTAYSQLATDINSTTATTGLTAVIASKTLTITEAGASTLTITSASPTYYPNASNILIVPASSTETNCGQVFAQALPLSSSTVPTNTLQAALNVARNPYMGGAGNAATFLALQSGIGTTPYTPNITPTGAGTVAAKPFDLSAAIFYPQTLMGGGLYNASATLDANDTLYVLQEQTSSSPYYYETTSMSSNGVVNYTTPYCLYNAYSQTAVASTSCPNVMVNANHIVADAAGDLFVSIGGSTAATGTYVTTQAGVIQLTASTGAFANIPANTSTQESVYPAGTYDYGMAVDQANNLWVGTSTSTSLFELPYVGTGSATIGTATQAGALTNAGYQIVIDGNQNIYSSNYATSAGTASIYVEPNTALTANTYPQSPANGAIATTPTYTLGSSVLTHNTPNATVDYDLGAAVDGSGNIYYNAGTTASIAGANDGIFVATPTYSLNAGKYSVTSLSTTTSPIAGAAFSTTNGLINVLYSRSDYMEADGDGAIWVPDVYGDTPIRLYGTSGTSVMGYYPCIGATCVLPCTSGSTCSTGYSTAPVTAVSLEAQGGLYGAKELYVDSTGAVWVMCTSNGASSSVHSAGNIVQIFGPGTPTFPLAQAGHPGVMP